MKTFLVWTHVDIGALEIQAEDKRAALAIALARPTPVIGSTLCAELPGGDVWSAPRAATPLKNPFARTKQRPWQRWL